VNQTLSLLKYGLCLSLFSVALLGAEKSQQRHYERAESGELFLTTIWNHDFDSPIGPFQWGNVSAACSQGRRQSPVNIVTGRGESDDGRSSPITLFYPAKNLVVENNGHVIEVPYENGAYMMTGGRSYDLLQFHFHTRGEHFLNSASYDMEVHFVHRDRNGSLAVIGYWIRACHPLDGTCRSNPVIDTIFANAPTTVGENDVHTSFTPLDFLPVRRRGAGAVLETYFNYDGSLTTPPCTEGVRWFVARQPIIVSTLSLARFRQIIGNFPNYLGFQNNYRLPQPLNGRRVRLFGAGDDDD